MPGLGTIPLEREASCLFAVGPGSYPDPQYTALIFSREARLTGFQKNGSGNESITCYRRLSSCFECFFLRAVYQLPVGERRRFQDALQRVPEHVRVVAVVEPPLHLFQVAIQVLGADLVEGPDNGALEQRPDALDTIGVNIADHPFVCGVVHCFVARVAVGDAQLGLQLVCVNGFGVAAQVFLDESVQRLAFYIGNPGQADLPAPLEAPATQVLPLRLPDPTFFFLPPTRVSSTSTIPNSVGPSNGSLPIASRMRWHRYHAVWYEPIPSVRFIWLAEIAFRDSSLR